MLISSDTLEAPLAWARRAERSRRAGRFCGIALSRENGVSDSALTRLADARRHFSSPYSEVHHALVHSALKRVAAKAEHARYGATQSIRITLASELYRAEATDGHSH